MRWYAIMGIKSVFFDMRNVMYFALVFFCACSDESPLSLNNYLVPNEFDLELIAHEPMLHAPVAMDFDEQGRIWVLEMPAYMPNVEGQNEGAAVNSIKVLSDTDNDGEMDHVLVFMDSLVLPRTMLLVYGGLLYAEPSNLWFVEIQDDKAGKKTLVDSVYAVDGNVEHQPNSLMLNMDNWIYSSSANTRYRLDKGNWIKEYTTPRGQWGLSKDNYGRLVYNNNALLLAADRILPNALFSNPYIKLQENNQQIITENQRVYPIQATAVNRGYQDGVLLSNGFLKDATSACAPLCYRDEELEAWHNSAFVALPEINAIKKLELQRSGFTTSAIQSDTTKEYLISLDEGFRPVQLKIGPDGNMYIVDMHRGIIQHKAFMTSYLREKILGKGLNKITGQGRILKLGPLGQEIRPLGFDVETDPMAQLYSHNSFLRDKAQHYIVSNGRQDLVPQLIKNLNSDLTEIQLLHTLWTLEGLSALTESILMDQLLREYNHLVYHAMHLLTKDEIVDKRRMLDIVARYEKEGSTGGDYILANHLGGLNILDDNALVEIYKKLLLRNNMDAAMVEAITADNPDKEDVFLSLLELEVDSSMYLWQKYLEDIKVRKGKNNPVYYYNENLKLEDRRTVGMQLYLTTCAQCHGVDGEGKENIAPPLLDSEFVRGRDDRLILITLHGMMGPFEMDGKYYNFSGAMPGVHYNDALSDADIKDILHFVKNAFNSSPYSISEDDICRLRNYTSGEGAFTQSSLDSVLYLLDQD